MSKLIIYIVFSLFGLLSVCVGQVVQIGQCDPNVPIEQDFNIESFLSTWHEISRLDNPNQNGDCSKYELSNDNNVLNIQHKSVNRNFLEEAKGTITQDGNTAKLKLAISSFENPIDFWVRSTDYTTFAITFSCENISNTQRRIHIWVLGRERAFSEMALALIYTTISNTFNIQPSEFRSIDHSDNACYILPVIEPGDPIILPGQCDQTLPVLQNFNLDRFLGLWHQVSSYETPNSNGACVRAEYSRSNGGVNILNSEVVNQQLLTLDGHATVSSTDNTAKLSVVLNIPGATPTPRDLWILASDYDSYAVAYTCINTSPTNKQVYSWILSRTRVLPQSAQTAVDRVIDSYLDLNYQYYKQTDQSDAGCFFYPEYEANKPVVFRGQCESVNVQAMQNFNIERYMGLWHNIELYPTAFQSGTCSNAKYDLVGSSVTVVNSQVNNERLYTVDAVAVPATTDGSAKLIVTFPIPGSDQTVSSDYWVLGTDYDNYALVYGCTNLNADEMQVSSWKLSRTKSLAPASATAINNIVNTVSVLDQRYYEVMDQTVQGCFYYPEPQPGQAVVFPGQCDNNIAAVPNFDLNAFQGTWHEITSYPKDNQPGECIREEFTVTSPTSMHLNSFSVINQRQFTAEGVVTFATNDGSGKLQINLINMGPPVPVPYWILSTDYTDYALVYSCRNINSDYREIWSWKLSRTRQLSNAGSQAIDNAMLAVDVLRNEYFEDIDQSDAACFHLPDIEPGQDVVLPGQCDENIRGIPNFDITRFSGEWRLIESYGSQHQSGTCNVMQYRVSSNNVLAVTNSQVVNAALGSISGTATVSSTDGSGKLTFAFSNIPGTEELIVLDTDYDSYALYYGCANMANNQRRVTSWKLSRTNTLTQDATEKINRIMDSIEVLHQPYYYTVDRTPEGCFYFPVPDRNTPVRFRGQCDQNIPVVTNFDVSRYQGLWHDIQSYPMPFQDGECPNAFYAPYDSSSVTVTNTHVVNQKLDVITGMATAPADGSAKLKVTFNIQNTQITSDYWVLDTDYDSYALVYSCTNLDADYMTVSSWKLSRTKSLSTAAETAINNVMNNIQVLDQRYYINRDQTPEGCFYYPEPQPGQAVVFPGQCDNNIAAVPNFDLNAFQGTWHEITSYPKDNQPGECIREEFTVTSPTSMHLNSFSVINQRQFTAEGVVTFATNDGSGKLQINLINMGPPVPVPYWILSTDYTDYALVYSCRNINSDYREIWSWKLSRSRQLSNAGSQAIDNAMLAVDVLRNEYFEDIDQSDAACFHLPDIEPGQDVVLPGQCDENIRGISNFDITRFSGEWRLIESYGSRYQSGTCNVAEYRVSSNNVLAVTNSQVVNAALGSISGTATVSSTDGSGKLIFGYSTRPRTYELFVLDTDYDSYALYYGCANMANNQRRVTSWKLSRTNTLTQDANEKINRIMGSIEVLHQPYYYTVDRTPEGCFYFPVPDRNTPVRFRGQCDQNIPVVTNFDVSRYQGLWHDIQSYPMPFQDGECPNAFYAPYDSSSVTVTNTHVVNQKLDVITGMATAPADGSAKLKVTFNIQNTQITSDYWVLDTDYDSYALVYSCTNLDADYMTVSSWKLSRTKSLSTAAETAINNVMNNIQVLDQRYYINRDQTPEGCFYYPEPQPGQAVVFPGQCDNNIAAVPNFDLNAFQGTWHEITSYPKDNQPGECIREEFTVTSPTSMHLNSFSVINQRQFTAEGVVTFATNDGSGKLQINLINMGPPVPVPYWILSTDYTDYALVYSCRNINSDYREIWSWKLSRSRQLSNAGSQAIDNAMLAVDVLRNEYFEDIDQSDAACFHLPDIEPGQDVVLPGQCDENIRGISNFDITRFAGEWRLIESYGSRYQSGTCNVAEYRVSSNNVLAVTNSQVVNAALGSISGTATVSSTDGSGKLIFGYSTRPRTYELFVLDTDYDSYALYYGCANMANNQRRVTSWKLSRTNTLTQDATEKINRIMDSIDVLHQPYYYTVDRTPEGCFYFPVPDRNTPVRFRGQCDQNIPVVTNFDVSRYQGLWHDIQSYPMPFQDGECPNAFYAPYDSSSVTVTNTHVVNQKLDVITGMATAPADGSAKLKVTFNIQNNQITSDYWVLDTDYDSYALVYSCTNLDADYMTVSSWKLSRTKSLSSAAETAINNVMNNIQVLDQRYYINRDQTPEGCFYYPEPQPGQAVVFPGQCDNNIAAVPNFDLNAFQGTWHEITSYPKDNQPGECIREEFTVTSPTSMHLNSFSVINQRQFTAQGVVTFATNDGSGKLQIDLINMGPPVPVPYWILSTDYTDYALVYSCRNINSDYREIWSWKLSRTRQLSNAGNQAIDNAMLAVDVLRNEYFEDIDQTDTACFYYPVLGPTEPVIFPGQCDVNIPVVQNFDVTRYMGRWRLIESYYSDFQEGTCNAATYTENNDGTVTVYNTKVVAEQLNSITGSAVLASDGSAKLTVTFPNGTPPVEYWILGTDYYSYALVYSCVNLPNDRRRVWTWKMSRTDSLTALATNSINQIMNTVNVLDARYYQTVDQTDTGCFYFPEPDRDTTVVFPGQCDENIPVVANFDAARYAGTWYDIESYPTNFQSGTCNTATYTANTDGTITIQNTQVVDQVLQTTTGTATSTAGDNSAKFDVTFSLSSGPATTKYWVLATDYDSFSLVYSCRNINSESRAVYSWKLSRTHTLPPAAEPVINNIINNVQVLEQRYYVRRSHTEESCFYYPDNNGGDVILDGQCVPDAEVPAVLLFNPTAFSGTWHEVARFPSALQNGECTATQYLVNGNNGFNVIHTSVIEEALLSTNEVAEVVPLGRGVISFDISEVPFNNIFILATDYNEYALAYSCRNIDANRKQVYSWKLSRSRAGLSEDANRILDEVVRQNIDLFEGYYRYTKQDNTACFYYPVHDQLPDSIILPGPCDESIRGVPNFNANSYLGTWYETARYPISTQQGQCNRGVYTSLNGVIYVENSQVISEHLTTISGQATVAGQGGFGDLIVTFNVGGETRIAQYSVLATDYISYALLYSCTNLNDGNRQVYSWKLSRTTSLPPQANIPIDNAIAATQGLHEMYYQPTSQTDESCFYYPEFDELPETIVLPGPCDDSIVAVPNFNVANYLGDWIEVARYPQTAQNGQCNRATYSSAGGSSVTIENSQVVNEALHTISGQGVLASQDGSGVLQVTFNVGGEIRTSNYYVLATDYISYSLVYTCTNLPSGNRQVGSWKLSRTGTFSQNALDTMDYVITNTQGLNQTYYQDTSQTDDSCFYYPEPMDDGLGQSIMLPGNCDTSIRGVSNFNGTAFARTWYHIHRYDSVQGRTCSGTRMTFNEETGILDVTDFEVVDGELETTEYVGRVSSTDGSGIITLEIADEDSGESTNKDLYILATNYNEYALAYSCENVGTRRRVRAWQLSTDRTMSATGAATIAEFVRNMRELHTPYFNEVPHNEECLEPSSAILFKSSIIVIFICTVLQALW